MIFPSSDISKHLKNFGLNESDTIMIHGDAGVAAQYIFDDCSNPISEFILHLFNYFHKGTVIVPTFTYSATKGEVFDPSQTSSEIGQFSETFRKMEGVIRSCHPIFSVSCFGNQAEYFTDTKNTDCFGKDTFFDKLYTSNVKILALGCGLDRVTFLHFIEQHLNVSYRYLKNFKAQIKNNKIIEETSVSYFVRKLDLDSNIDLSDFEKEAIRDDKLIKKSFGRFNTYLISSRDFFNISSKLIKQDEYALIHESGHE